MISLILKNLIGTAITAVIAVILFSQPARSLQPSSYEVVNYMQRLSFEQLAEVRAL